MADFSRFKTTNTAYWSRVRGVPAWLLNSTGNVWDALMDQITAAVASFTPYAPVGVAAPITVGASPFSYTAGAGPEIIYISGGSVSSVVMYTHSLSSQMPLTVILPAGATLTVTFTEAPGMVKVY